MTYPEEAQKSKVSGTVILEFDEGEDCKWSNPVIIQKAGYGFDEVALSTMRKMINRYNACIEKCKTPHCQHQKLKQSFHFTYTD